MKRLCGLSSVWSLVLVSACAAGTAALVRRDPYGGTLALQGDPKKAMQDAHLQMAQHCSGQYWIASEEMVPVGQRTQQGGDEGPNEYGGTSYQHGSVTTELREHRISYQCGPPPQAAYPPAPAVPAAPAAPAPAPVPSPPPVQ